MIPTDEDITEHLLRVLPTAEAELIYLESRCTTGLPLSGSMVLARSHSLTAPH